MVNTTTEYTVTENEFRDTCHTAMFWSSKPIVSVVNERASES